MKMLYTTALLLSVASLVQSAEPFTIKIDRAKTVILQDQKPPNNKLVEGTISLNGKPIGISYENGDYLIALGSYKGVMRYVSPNGFAQNPFGKLAQQGDFLIEIAGVPPNRTNLLFHGGDKPKFSQGCVMLGPVVRTGPKQGQIEPDHPLRILRTEFYGSEEPIASPDKAISIVISDDLMVAAKKAKEAAAQQAKLATEAKQRQHWEATQKMIEESQERSRRDQEEADRRRKADQEMRERREKEERAQAEEKKERDRKQAEAQERERREADERWRESQRRAEAERQRQEEYYRQQAYEAEKSRAQERARSSSWSTGSSSPPPAPIRPIP